VAVALALAEGFVMAVLVLLFFVIVMGPLALVLANLRSRGMLPVDGGDQKCPICGRRYSGPGPHC
jgi:hypothetical protein